MTVFDPRLPHGVPVVEGTRDPREGRLVIHGWFNEPSPFFAGALTETDAEPILNEVLPSLYASLAVRKNERQDTHGCSTARSVRSPCVKVFFFFPLSHYKLYFLVLLL